MFYKEQDHQESTRNVQKRKAVLIFYLFDPPLLKHLILYPPSIPAHRYAREAARP